MTTTRHGPAVSPQHQRVRSTGHAAPTAPGAPRRFGHLALACLAAAALAACGGASSQGGSAPRQEATALPTLGSVQGFAVLAGQTVTNTGPTTVAGDLGVSPGTSVTGFPPGLVSDGVIHATDAVALQAQADLTVSYDDLAGRACDFDSTGVDLAGRTLTAGVTCFSSAALLSGDLVLDAQGLPDAVFIFQVGSSLATASNASVRVVNGGQDCNVFWQVGSSATLGTGTTFVGSILALTSIDLATGASLAGRALARNGAVTLDSNRIAPGSCGGCAGTTCGVACVDTATDAANCGACGNACAAGAACNAGVCSMPLPPVCRDLGPAAPFDVFTLGNFTTNGGFVEGAMAAGDDFWATNFSVGQGLGPSSVALVVGGDLRYTNGAVNGDLIVGQTICWICDVVVAGTVSSGRPIDFRAAATSLRDLSADLAALPATGTATLQGTTLLLSGTGPVLNVFSVPLELLAGVRELVLQVPAGSGVLVNVVGGGNAQLHDVIWTSNGLPAGRTLFNFDQAGGVEIQGSTIEASILAPNAIVWFSSSGAIIGQVVGWNFTGTAQVGTAPFAACIETP